MTYQFQDRLQHNKDRFTVVNTETVTFRRIGIDDTEIEASPILLSAAEINMSSGTLLRKEEQMWGINLSELGDLFPPTDSDKIIRANGEEFRLLKRVDKELLYEFTTSERERILVNSKRVKGPS